MWGDQDSLSRKGGVILSRIEMKDGKIMAEVRDNHFSRIRTF